LSRFWYFARVELRPPMPNEFGQVQEGIQKIVKSASTGAWRQLTVKVKEFLSIYSIFIYLFKI
jgi:F-type H+-transporting ATPase subunit g